MNEKLTESLLLALGFFHRGIGGPSESCDAFDDLEKALCMADAANRPAAAVAAGDISFSIPEGPALLKISGREAKYLVPH